MNKISCIMKKATSVVLLIAVAVLLSGATLRAQKKEMGESEGDMGGGCNAHIPPPPPPPPLPVSHWGDNYL